MPNSSRRTPHRRPAPKRFPRVALYAAVIVAGLALGATLVVVAKPRRTVAQTPPVVGSQSSTPTPVPSPPALRTPNPSAAGMVAEVARPEPVRELVVKRMRERSREESLREFATVTALSLDRTATRAESGVMVAAALRDAAAPGTTSEPTLALLDRRDDLAGLPFLRGSACRKSSRAARSLAKGASDVKFLDHDRLGSTLSGPREWMHPERVAPLMQVVMAQPERNRQTMARHLARVGGKQATEALAKIALFDTDPDVRREAILSLSKRRAEEYLEPLLRGFEYPWPAVAEHAAEALAALKRVESVPALVAMLDAPDARAPYAKGAGPDRFVKEVVRVHHQFNCLVCHPPSFNETDPARALVPPLRSSSGMGSGYDPKCSPLLAANQTFVRTDITYLKQDYSVRLMDTALGISGEHRYDLLVRERLATSDDLVATLIRPNARREAAAFALRELTGQEPGAGGANWIRFARR